MPTTALSVPARPPVRTMFARAIRRRCPNCGGGGLFTNWLRMVPRCPTCGLVFSRGEDGYHLGAIWFNFIAAEAVTVGSLVTVLVTTWPNPPWDVLQYTAPVEAILTPVLFYPFAKTLFLAFDLWMRPIER